MRNNSEKLKKVRIKKLTEQVQKTINFGSNTNSQNEQVNTGHSSNNSNLIHHVKIFKAGGETMPARTKRINK